MKKSILCLLFAIAAMAWANDAAAQQCKKKVTLRVESTVAKGKMPPRWLLNKVTPAQYDTLVALNRLCTVDYSMLKGYKVTPQMVEKVMGQARKYIREAMDSHDGVVPRVGVDGPRHEEAHYVERQDRKGHPHGGISGRLVGRRL